MKNSYIGLAIFAVIAMMATAPVFATETKTSKSQMNSRDMTDKKMRMGDKMHMGQTSSMSGGYSILGSKFIGLEIENPQGENIGEVKDIMLDSSGKVRYVAVSYGGFMGIGDKMSAVPMEAFQFKRESNLFSADVKLVLDIDKDQLKNDKGFDHKNWPDLEDENYRSELDKRYKVERQRMSN